MGRNTARFRCQISESGLHVGLVLKGGAGAVRSFRRINHDDLHPRAQGCGGWYGQSVGYAANLVAQNATNKIAPKAINTLATALFL